MTDEAVQPIRTLSDELRVALDANADRLRQGVRAQLANPTTTGAARPLQFEIDPWSFRITCCATEEELLPDDWLEEILPQDWIERAEEAELNWDALIAETLCSWFAAGWRQEGGPAVLPRAYLFLHGFQSRQFDLARSEWRSSEEAFGA